MTQKASTQYGEMYYPRMSFAPYFANKGELFELLLDNDRLLEENYTNQSGANYEISLLARNPALQSEVKTKIGERLLAKIVGNVPEAIRGLGITQNINGEFITMETSSISLGVPALRDYRPPNASGKSERFEVKFGNIKNADLSLNRETISIYKYPDELIIGIWMEDLFEEDQQLEADWKPIYDKCGKIVEDNEYYLLEIPIKSNWKELNKQFECIAKNTKSPKIKQLIGLLVHAAEKVDLEALRPSYFSGENKVLKLSYFTELSDDNFEPVLEAYDMIEYSIENDVLNVTHFDVSEEGVKGRDKLNYTLVSEGSGTIIISGKIDVLDGDIVKVEMKSSLSPGSKEIEFAGNDRLVLIWE